MSPPALQGGAGPHKAISMGVVSVGPAATSRSSRSHQTFSAHKLLCEAFALKAEYKEKPPNGATAALFSKISPSLPSK